MDQFGRARIAVADESRIVRLAVALGMSGAIAALNRADGSGVPVPDVLGAAVPVPLVVVVRAVALSFRRLLAAINGTGCARCAPVGPERRCLAGLLKLGVMRPAVAAGIQFAVTVLGGTGSPR